MVLTHGHYLDASQTRGNDLSDNLGAAKSDEEIHRAARTIFIETAQYQTMANAVSFTKGTRSFVDDLVGPDGLANKISKLFRRIGDWILRLLYRDGSARGKEISAKCLENIDCFIERFCGYAKPPRWFVFGHSHRQGRAMTSHLGIEVYNVGSAYPDGPKAFTFARIDASGDAPVVRLMNIDHDGNVRESPTT